MTQYQIFSTKKIEGFVGDNLAIKIVFPVIQPNVNGNSNAGDKLKEWYRSSIFADCPMGDFCVKLTERANWARRSCALCPYFGKTIGEKLALECLGIIDKLTKGQDIDEGLEQGCIVINNDLSSVGEELIYSFNDEENSPPPRATTTRKIVATGKMGRPLLRYIIEVNGKEHEDLGQMKMSEAREKATAFAQGCQEEVVLIGINSSGTRKDINFPKHIKKRVVKAKTPPPPPEVAKEEIKKQPEDISVIPQMRNVGEILQQLSDVIKAPGNGNRKVYSLRGKMGEICIGAVSEEHAKLIEKLVNAVVPASVEAQEVNVNKDDFINNMLA